MLTLNDEIVDVVHGFRHSNVATGTSRMKQYLEFIGLAVRKMSDRQ